MAYDANAAKAWFDSLPVKAEKPGFLVWMGKVNVAIINATGVEADDLPDFCYLDSFEDGATPAQAAKAAIKAAKEF